MAGRRLALAIGINRYSNASIDNLKFAVTDASDVATVLRDPTIGYFDDVRTLLDEEATSSNCEDYLHRLLCKDAKPDDLVVLYFAGHSVLDVAGKLCLSTCDFKHDIALQTCIHLSRLRVFLDNSNCRRIVTILDTCYSSAASKSLGFTRNFQSEQFALDALSGEGQIVLASSSADQPSREPEELQHGVFTYYLLMGLRGAAQHNSRGVISATSLFTFVSSQFKKEDRQTPRFYGSALSGDIYLARNLRVNQQPERPQLVSVEGCRKYFVITLLRAIEHATPQEPYKCEVAVDVLVGGKAVAEISRGTSVVEVSYITLRKALEKFYPMLRSMTLNRSDITIVSDEINSIPLFKVSAEWQDAKLSWATVGISQQFLKAVQDAMSSGITWKLETERSN
jgi:hypothetical protein